MSDIVERLKAALSKASPAPWKADTKEHVGDNWLLGSVIDCGADDYSNWIVTTDRIRASQMDSGDAKSDAEFMALARNELPAVLDRIAELEAEVERAEADATKVMAALADAVAKLETAEAELERLKAREADRE